MASSKRNRPDKDGSHRLAYERNKAKIMATQTVCGICGKPVDKSLRYPHPLSPCIDHIIPVAKGGHPSSILPSRHGNPCSSQMPPCCPVSATELVKSIRQCRGISARPTCGI